MFNTLIQFLKDILKKFKRTDFRNRITDFEATLTDWWADKETGVAYEIRNQSGKWGEWQPRYEPQKFKFDTNGCVQFSFLNVVETQCNFLKAKHAFTKEQIDWFENNGYLVNGDFEFSDRFMAIKAGCNVNGSVFSSPETTVRKVGLLPESDFTYSMADSLKFESQKDMCNDYYNPKLITPEMETKAKKVLDILDISYEWVTNSKTDIEAMRKALKQSPLHVGVPVCLETWNLGYVMPCGQTRPAHGVMIYEIDDVGSAYFFDQYQPYLKNFATTYPIPIVMKVVVTVKNAPKPVLSNNYIFANNLKYGMINNEVKELQKTLKYLGLFNLEPTGYFGPVTKQSVMLFQTLHQLPTTGYVGELTRNELNNLRK